MTHDRPSPPRFDPYPAEVLNAALDSDVTSRTDTDTRASSTSAPTDATGVDSPGRSNSVDPLLEAARKVRAMPLDAHEEASAAQLDAIWQAVLARAEPRPAAGQPLPEQPVLVRGRSRVIGIVAAPSSLEWGRFHFGAVQSWVSLAAILAILIGMGSMAWSLRPGGGDNLLASATSLAVGTAYASPSPVAGNAWMRWPVLEDCDVAPMSHEAYAEIMSTQPDISGRSYTVTGVPTQADAEAAADVARISATCGLYGLRDQARSLESPAKLFYASDTSNRTVSREELNARGLEGRMLISAMAPAQNPNAYAVILAATPPAPLLDQHRATGQNQPLIGLTFDPANALLLEDGRIAIPATALYWKDDFWEPQQWQIDESDSFSTVLYVLTDASGTWKVDETLTFCPYAGCYSSWEAWANQVGIPVPTLDVPGPLPWTIPAGTATPAASPESEGTATPAL